jgi:hypothetical protein
LFAVAILFAAFFMNIGKSFMTAILAPT